MRNPADVVRKEAEGVIRQIRRVSRPFFHYQKPGSPPGLIADIPDEAATLEVIAYGPNGHVREVLEDLDRLEEFRKEWDVVWLNIDGVGDADILRELGDKFGISALSLEDVQSVGHRPKVDLREGYTQVILRMAGHDELLDMEQISLFFREGFVVTFQEADHPGDCLDPVRQRVIDGAPRMISSGADYLAYAIIDRVVDAFFPVLEAYAESFSELEARIIDPKADDLLGRMHQLNSELLLIQRAVKPHREVVQTLAKNPDGIFEEKTAPYLHDCLDHAVQIAELAEDYRTLGAHLLDYYLSLASHRQNEITKVLTIIATIFIPLTFVAGVYGMNFNVDRSPLNMPELNWYYGYPAALGFMLLLGVAFFLYFINRGWIGRSR